MNQTTIDGTNTSMSYSNYTVSVTYSNIRSIRVMSRRRKQEIQNLRIFRGHLPTLIHWLEPSNRLRFVNPT